MIKDHHHGRRRFDAERLARIVALLAKATAELLNALHIH
jgi:hypothetical protein